MSRLLEAIAKVRKPEWAHRRADVRMLNAAARLAEDVLLIGVGLFDFMPWADGECRDLPDDHPAELAYWNLDQYLIDNVSSPVLCLFEETWGLLERPLNGFDCWNIPEFDWLYQEPGPFGFPASGSHEPYHAARVKECRRARALAARWEKARQTLIARIVTYRTKFEQYAQTRTQRNWSPPPWTASLAKACETIGGNPKKNKDHTDVLRVASDILQGHGIKLDQKELRRLLGTKGRA